MKSVYAQFGMVLGAAAAAIPDTKTLFSTQLVTITSCGPSVTNCPAASTVTSTIVHSSTAPYQCNPAHSYPNGQKCDATARTLIYPSTTGAPAATTSAYKCNPAHSYPNGQKCDGTALTLIYPSTTAAPVASSSAYRCNPAHSYPNGQSCDGSALTLVYPSTTAAPAASSSAYKCNPAHSYPNGQKCDATALTLIYPSTTAAPAASSSVYQCNPAHSYPNGQKCDATARTLIYPASSAPAASTPAASKASAVTGKVCQTTLSGAYETPHLIVPVDSKNPDKAYGTQYNAYLSADNSTVFNFDIPYSYQGKQCTVLFLFPEQKDLVTSSFTQSGAGGLTFSSLVSPVDQQTTFKNQPAVKSELNHFDGVKPGNSYVVSTGACAAGTKQAIKVSSTGGYSLQYFQDWNPSPIGLFMTSC